MNLDEFPAPEEGFVITHVLVVADQDRSREFYRSLLGGQVLLERDPVIMKVANTGLPGMVGQGREVPDRAQGSRTRDPRLPARPGRSPDRGWPGDRTSALIRNPAAQPSG